MRLNYKTIGYVAVTLILFIGLIVLAARHDKAKIASEQTKKPATTQKAPAKLSPQPAKPTSPVTSSGQSPNPGNNLPNNGPGDVAALFVGAVSISALGYHFKQRRTIN